MQASAPSSASRVVVAGAGDREHPGAGAGGDLDRERADAAARTPDQQPLAGLEPQPPDRLVRGARRDRHRSRLDV